VSNVKSLQEKDNKAIDVQIYGIIKEIQFLDNQNRRNEGTITAHVQHIAELLEEKYNRAGTPDFINTICTTILRLFKDNDLERRCDTVLLALPDRYKLLRKSTSHLAEASAKRTEESSIVEKKIAEFFHWFNNLPLEDFIVRQLQDIAEDVTDASDRVLDYCNANKVKTVMTGDPYSWVDGLNAAKPAAVHLKKAPDALEQPGDDAKAWKRLASICERMAKARMDYPNHDPVRLHKEIHAVTALCDLWEPLVNRKYRYHYGQMNKMIYEASEQSGTAAASHSGVICAHTVNPKTGLPELRKITKEQIDAIHLPFYNKLNHMMYYLPMIGDVTDYAHQQFEKEDGTYLADRAREVGPKLQKVK
jgi:hypothetical protein